MIDLDEESQERKDQAALKAACATVIANNFDAVQIIATRYDGESGTVISGHGLGNFYARVGAVDQWRENVKNNA